MMAVVFALALVGCAPPTGQPNPGQPVALKVEMTTYAMAMAVPGNGEELNSEGKSRLLQFIRMYERRARSPIHIATPPRSDSYASQSLADDMLIRLSSHGINLSEIVVDAGLSTISDENAIVLSFRGYRVQVPECGDWSGNSGFNPTNLPHTNFGCAYQRNFGLMLSDPGELLRSRPLGPIDAPRMGVIVEGYRAGPTTTSTTSTGSGTSQ